MLLVLFTSPLVLVLAAVGGYQRRPVLGLSLFAALLAYAAFATWTAWNAGPTDVCDSDLSCRALARATWVITGYLTAATLGTYVGAGVIGAWIARQRR